MRPMELEKKGISILILVRVDPEINLEGIARKAMGRIGFLTRAQLGNMDLSSTGFESFCINLIAISGYCQGGSDILFLRIGTSQIEDHLLG